MITNQFTPEQLAWLTTLEAGTYLQTVGRLETVTDGEPSSYCCLGVACDLQLPPELHNVVAGRGYYGGEAHDAPHDVVKNLQLKHKVGAFSVNDAGGTGNDHVMARRDDVKLAIYSLAQLNDNARFSFAEIAAFIRTWPWLVFTNFDRTYQAEMPELLDDRKIEIVAWD